MVALSYKLDDGLQLESFHTRLSDMPQCWVGIKPTSLTFMTFHKSSSDSSISNVDHGITLRAVYSPQNKQRVDCGLWKTNDYSLTIDNRHVYWGNSSFQSIYSVIDLLEDCPGRHVSHCHLDLFSILKCPMPPPLWHMWCYAFWAVCVQQ